MQEILLQLQSAPKFKVKDLFWHDVSFHYNTLTQFDIYIYSYFEAQLPHFSSMLMYFYIVNDRIVKLQNYVNPL